MAIRSKKLMVITGAAVRVPARRRSLPRFALKQQLAAMCERFAGQGAVDFRISFRPGWQRFGVPACQVSLVVPIDRGEIRIVAQLHGVSSVMHEDRKQQDDRQRDADQPKQRTFSETHRSLRVTINRR
jgi:hypothetical protein